MKKGYLSRFARASFLLFIPSALVYMLTLNSPAFADLINSTVAVAVRAVLSYITYLIPFSFFELLIILVPLILIIAIVVFIKSGKSRGGRIRCITSLLALISLLLSSYVFTLGVGYKTTALSKKIDVEDRRDFTAYELYDTTLTVIGEINALADTLDSNNGETVMQYSINDLSDRLVDAFDAMNGRYSLLTNYTSRVKPVYYSTVMSDLGISGIYSFFTGEANVNVEYPDYCIPFTAAHEMAHQRGIARENEANFVAFLVCISSEDDYIRYSGYLNLYEYLASALYRTDEELYRNARASLSDVAKSDMRASSAVYNLHKDSVLGKINERLNDAYLKANGTEGVVSYGYVVRLAVGYYQSENNK